MVTIYVCGSIFFADQIKNVIQWTEKECLFVEREPCDIVVTEEDRPFATKIVLFVDKEKNLIFYKTNNLERTYFLADIGIVLDFAIQTEMLKMSERTKAADITMTMNLLKEDVDNNELNLETARNIQLVENSRCKIEGYDTDIIFVPKSVISGDFLVAEKIYDKIFIMFGDVTGHGYYGGIYGATLIGLARSYLRNASLMQANLLGLVNYMKSAAFFYHGNSGYSSAEVVFCEIDEKKETASFVFFGSGGISPIVISDDLKAEPVLKPSDYEVILPRLGDTIFEDEDFDIKIVRVPFDETDALFFYTDGITELFSSENKDFKYIYGPDNLTKTIGLGKSSKPSDIIHNVVTDLISYGVQGLRSGITLEDIIYDDAMIYCIKRSSK